MVKHELEFQCSVHYIDRRVLIDRPQFFYAKHVIYSAGTQYSAGKEA